jgi:D-inositol-3-phosphate glycosyltransferase
MFHVTLPSIPLPQESYKDQNPQRVSVSGAEVAKLGFLKALLRYSACERYYLVCETQRKVNEAKDRLACYPQQERIEPVLLDDYHRLRQIEEMILFHPDPALQPLVNLRAFKGRRTWPIVGLTHSMSGGPGFWFVFGALLEALYSYDCLVCTSEAGRKAGEGILANMNAASMRKYGKPLSSRLQLPVIPLGTDAEVFQPRDKVEARERCKLPQDRVLFLYLGRFSTQYKVDLFPLVLAYSQLASDKRNNACLILAGDDVQHGLTPKLRTFASELGVADQVLVFPNPTSDEKICLYNAADVFVSPSDSIQETFGLTIIEAMASGLPVIASDWSGYRDTVEHGSTGFLVPTFWADCSNHLSRTPFLREPMELYKQLGQATSVDMKALVNYMELLVDNPTARRKMGDAARRRVLANYDWPVIIRQHEALWMALMERARNGEEEEDYDVMSFDYLDVFRHYPTHTITPKCKVQITAMGLALAHDAARLRSFEYSELSEHLDLNRRILAACKDEKEIELGELIRNISDEASSAGNGIFQQIAQSVKYGMLEICCATSDSSRSALR